MASSGFEIAPNFVPILWISKLCPYRGYSQLITSWVKFGFLNGYPKILTVEIANLLTHYIKSCNYLVILLKSIFSITDHLQTLTARR